MSECRYCHGHGVVGGASALAKSRRTGNPPKPCRCSARAAFRVCLSFYEQLAWSSDPRATEYRTDFEAVAKHALDPQQWAALRLRRLMGVPLVGCVRRTGMTRAQVVRVTAQAEAAVGKALVPYQLYPIAGYFERRLVRG